MKKTLLNATILVFATLSLNAQTTFSAKQAISPTADTPYNIATGLINGDAYNDIIIGTFNASTLEIYINNGDGTFATPAVILSNTIEGIVGLKLADLNGDGFLDVIGAGYNNNTIGWFANDGSGNFGGQQTITTSLAGASGLVIADLDNNGTSDVVCASNIDNLIVWYSNDGIGNFSAASILDNSMTAPATINFKDIDADGDLDFVASDSNFNNCKIEIFRSNFIQDGTITYTKDANSVTTGKFYLFNADFVDMDNDGDFDILATDVAYNSFPGSAYWYRNDASVFTEVLLPTTLANPATAQLKDLDVDGLNDLIISNGQGEGLPGATNNPDIVWFKGNGDGTFGPENVIDTTQSQVFVYSIEDFDNDTDLDIATCSYNQDALNWFENLKFTLGTDEFSSQQFNVYPNPTKGTLKFKGFTDVLTLSVYDILGKNIKNVTLGLNQSLDVTEFNSGVYILKIEGFDSVFRFIKE